jgi:hypothetical protein
MANLVDELNEQDSIDFMRDQLHKQYLKITELQAEITRLRAALENEKWFRERGSDLNTHDWVEAQRQTNAQTKEALTPTRKAEE